MFKNVLLGFSLLCGFLLPNHINAFASQPPLAYSWQTGDSDASAIVMPPLPTGYTRGEIKSVATDAAGNAVMVGYAYKGDGTLPLAYSWTNGDAEATQITTALPAECPRGSLVSVAINADGNAVMVGEASKTDHSDQIPLAYSWTTGEAEATPITFPSDLPDGFPKPNLWSVAIDAAGNAVMVGTAQIPTEGRFLFKPIAYRLNKGVTRAEKITLPELPVGESYGALYSVAINSGGNAVIVGYAFNFAGYPDVPLAYSLADGATEATQITLPTLPTEYTGPGLQSVAINADGNAVMVGEAKNDDGNQIPLAYSWKTGTATRITTDLPAESTSGYLTSVAINAAGNAVMAGGARNADDSDYIPLAYSWKNADAAASQITIPAMPAGYTIGTITSVATDAAGNAVMVGKASKADYSVQIPLTYSWNTGDASAIETPPPYHEYPIGALSSVAITSDGKAIMGGSAIFAAPNTGGAFHQQPFQQ